MDIGPIEKCATRIAKALAIRGMRQADLCQKTKIPKSAMSQYISGAFEPKQDRVALISQALNVDPVWLMGYDVPMEKKAQPETKKVPLTEAELSEGEKALLALFKRVPKDQQQLVLQMIRAALGSQE